VREPRRPSLFLQPAPPKKPEPDHAAEVAAANERDANAITRFFNVMLNDTLRPSCSRLGRVRRKKP
jgi:hypothetical protein